MDNLIVTRARNSFDRSIPLKERLIIVERLRRKIAQNLEQIVTAIQEDIRKPSLDALGGDVLFTLEQLLWYEKNAVRILQPRSLSTPPFGFRSCSFEEVYTPYGVVLILAPWNYPLQLALVPALSAWIAGNSVILKPSEYASQTSNQIRELLASAGFPDYSIQVIDGGPDKVRSLINSRPDKIFVTGSTHTGREILRLASEKMIPVDLELGGRDAMVVFEDADLERAANAAVHGAYGNSGQVCVSIKRIYVQESVQHKFCELMKDGIRSLKIGYQSDDDVGPLARDQEVERLRILVNDAIENGARLETELQTAGRLVQPILLSDVPNHARITQEEAFGPVAWVDRFSTRDEAIQKVNHSPFGLSSSVWSRDLNQARSTAESLEVGSCAINDVLRHIANPAASFGGEKLSGWGRYHGEEGLTTFCKKRVIMTNRSKVKKEIHWIPSRGQISNQLKALIRLRHLGEERLKSFKNLLTASLTLPLAFITASARAETNLTSSSLGELSIKVTNLTENGGNLAYTVFQSKDGYPGDSKKALRAGFLSIPKGTIELTWILRELPPGEYAVSVFQDENNNQKLDKNFLGIPSEPVGASDNPKGRMGPPKYDDAKFEYKTELKIIEIGMVK